jgi:hypothetical protein
MARRDTPVILTAQRAHEETGLDDLRTMTRLIGLSP